MLETLLRVPLASQDAQAGRLVIFDAAAKLAATGAWAEFGVGSGRSAGELLKRLPGDGVLYLFDSEQGLPEDWHARRPKGSYRGSFRSSDPRCHSIIGWFKDTLPGFVPAAALTLVHIDCDLYSSTATVLQHCGQWMIDGTILIFDELYNYPEYAQHEWRALAEWLSVTGFRVEWKLRGTHQGMGVLRC